MNRNGSSSFFRFASRVLLAPLFLFAIESANAELQPRLGGQAVYDTGQNITWLADANLAASNTFGVGGIRTSGPNGGMTWNNAVINYLPAMNVADGNGHLGYAGWQLPTLAQITNLFYDELGGTTGQFILLSGDPDLDLFTNIEPLAYWTSTSDCCVSFLKRTFLMFNGTGAAGDRNAADTVLVWPVALGDPFPASPPPAVPISLPARLVLVAALLLLGARRMTVRG